MIKFLKTAIPVLAIAVGIYPFIMYALSIPFGIIEDKNDAILSDLIWEIAFHSHIILASVALLTGWVQFWNPKNSSAKKHKVIGYIYTITALISSISSLMLSYYSSGGLLAIMGFVVLSMFWYYTTLKGMFFLRNSSYMDHRRMMIYSYASCFSGVTLRLILPILNYFISDFNQAYAMAAWFCWIPNLLVAYAIDRSLNLKKIIQIKK